MDTLEFNKIAAAVIGSFLVLQLLAWGGEIIYHPHGEGMYSEYEAEETAAAEPVEAEPEVPFAEVLMTASAESGERLWRQCSACHALEQGANRVGPYLWGVVNRPKGAADGFAYSEAMANFGGEWTAENLNAFLIAPTTYLPGTKMVYRGMRDVEDRANLIAYLAATNGAELMPAE
jgi:cytochrome c